MRQQARQRSQRRRQQRRRRWGGVVATRSTGSSDLSLDDGISEVELDLGDVGGRASTDDRSCSDDVGDDGGDTSEGNRRMLYTLLDTNGNGLLDLTELPSAVRCVLEEVDAIFPVEEVDAMIEFLLQELGKDGNSSIDVAELVRLIEDTGDLYEPAGVAAAHEMR